MYNDNMKTVEISQTKPLLVSSLDGLRLVGVLF